VKKIILLLLALMAPSLASAADMNIDQPHWSFEIKGGQFFPSIGNWEQYHDKKYLPEYGAALGYKVQRNIEVGFSAGTAQGKGKGYFQGHSIIGGDVTYELYPVSMFVLARGVFSEKQWLVPYVGGGLTRIYYRESVKYQDSVRGSADGYHVRGGLQLLLDAMDQSAANSMYLDYGVHHTYFFMEAEYTSAKVGSTSYDIGGTAYLAGLLFEF
jgi:hypothetical protein